MKKSINGDYILFFLAAVGLCCSILLAYLPRNPEDVAATGVSGLSVLEDPQGSLRLADVSKQDDQFTREKSSKVYRHLTKSAIWIRFLVDSSGKTDETRFIEIHNAALENIEVYFPGAEPLRAGKTVDSRDIPIKTRCWAFPVPEGLSPDDPVYVRVVSSSIMLVPLAVVGAENLITQNFFETLFFGALLGMLLAVAFVNLFSYLLMKNWTFLIYALYLAALLIYHLSVHGFLYFLPLPFIAQSALIWISLCAVGIFMMVFAKQFMDLKNTLPIVNLLLDVNISLFVLQTVFALFISRYVANAIGYVTGFVMPLIIIASAIWLYAKGSKHLRFYILALCATLSAAVIWTTAAYIEARIPANYCFLAGTVIDSLLFTMAIFDHIRQELTEKESLGQREKYYMDLSRTDALTGLYNRRYLNELIKRLGADEELPLISSLIMIDLDNFKIINDSYGHLIGDLLLTKTASKIKKHIRKTDIACRYGGDEFLIYLPGANANVAHTIAEGIRNDILEDFSYSEEGSEIRHTISIGVTENRVDDSFDGLFLRADAALYQAKRTGRNKISVL